MVLKSGTFAAIIKPVIITSSLPGYIFSTIDYEATGKYALSPIPTKLVRKHVRNKEFQLIMKDSASIPANAKTMNTLISRSNDG